MPWRVERSASCPASKPFAVVNQDTGRRMGCHATRAAARQQLAALNANEPQAGKSHTRGPMETKALRDVEIKSAARGEVSAVFATFNVIDKDGDVTFPGAFTEGQEVLISHYAHKFWQGALPVGTGRIRTTKAEAILDGQFFMNTTAGRDNFEVVKAMGGRQEWSYGFDVLNPPEVVTFAGRKANALRKMHVHEVSPVYEGSGINTRTLAMKALAEGGVTPEEATRIVSATEYAAAIRPHETRVTTKRWDGRAVTAGLAAGTPIDDLRAVHAWVDPAGSPADPGAYGWAHHDGPDGEANLRACLAGVAELNGTKAAGLSDAERQSVYEHLALHLQDGDRDVPDLRSPGETGNRKFHEEAAAVLAGMDDLILRTSELMALRRSKGKGISAATVDVLEWVYDDMGRLRSLLDSPQEDAEREFARFVASQLRHQEP